jgi:hypothetical protein
MEKRYKAFIVIILLFTFILFYSYNIEDFLNDIEIISNQNMNIAQKEAAIMRINLYLNSKNKEELFKEIYALYLKIGYEKLYTIFNEIKKFFPSNLYNEIIDYLRKLKNEIESKNENQNKNDSSNSSSNTNNKDSNDAKNETKINSSNNNVKNEKEKSSSDTNKKTSDKKDNAENNFVPSYTLEYVLKKYGIKSSSDNTNNNEKKDEKESTNKGEINYNKEQIEKIFKEALNNFNKKNYDTALEYFYITIKNQYNVITSSYYIAYIYELKNDYDKSLDFYILTINLIQKEGKIDFYFLSYIYKKVGILYYFKSDYNQSEKYLIKSIEYNYQDGESYYYLGWISYNRGDYNKALNLWAQGINFNNDKCREAYNWLKEKLGGKN